MRFKLISTNPEDLAYTSEFCVMDQDDRSVELGPNTIPFLEPEKLLRLYTGFVKAVPGTDYERATRGFRATCEAEIARRLHDEYLRRGMEG